MEYTISIEGYLLKNGKRSHVQFEQLDSFEEYHKALDKSLKVKHTPNEGIDHFVAILFNDREKAIREGVPESKIETLKEGNLYRYNTKPLCGSNNVKKIVCMVNL